MATSASRTTHDDDEVSYNLAGQRLGRKGQETRERILGALLHQLQDRSGEPVTLTGVAREASVRLTNLYLYFPDLAALLLAGLRRVMDTADAGYVELLRERWPDEALGARAHAFILAHYDFWQRHARLLHMRNAMADSDHRILEYRRLRSKPLLDLLVRQMDGDPERSASPQAYMATVVLTGFERVATVVTGPQFHLATDTRDEDGAVYVDGLMTAQAVLLEVAIRRQRQAARA